MSNNPYQTTTEPETFQAESSRLRGLRYWISFVADHFLFGLALIQVVPPIPSNAGDRYSFSPMLLLPLIIGSRYLAIRRKEESWPGLALKSLMLTILGYVNYEAAFIIR